MEDWVLWLIAAVIFGVGEIATLGFFLAPFAGGAAVAAVVSAAGLPFVGSALIFLAVSIALLLALRPLARSHRRMPPQIRTGTAALIGREVLVLEAIDQDRGLVKLEGEEWSARAYIDGQTFEPGQRVNVVEIRGATALVSD